MTQQEKREVKINKVLGEVKARLEKSKNSELVKGWCNVLNMTGFFYSCGRLNDMQVLVRLVFAGITCDMKQDDFLELLADDTTLFNKGAK